MTNTENTKAAGADGVHEFTMQYSGSKQPVARGSSQKQFLIYRNLSH